MPGPTRPSFEPGKTINPGGRPRTTPDMLAARDNARASSVEMVEILIDIARHSTDDGARIKAANSVLDRALGKPTQAVEVSGSESGAPVVVVELPASFAPLAAAALASRSDDDGGGDAG